MVDKDLESYNEAVFSHAPFWRETTEDEMRQAWLTTSIMVNLPYGAKSITCKLIFNNKLKANDMLDKNEARLVVKRFK